MHPPSDAWYYGRVWWITRLVDASSSYFRCRRRTAARPTRPIPNMVTVMGSGTSCAVIVSVPPSPPLKPGLNMYTPGLNSGAVRVPEKSCGPVVSAFVESPLVLKPPALLRRKNRRVFIVSGPIPLTKMCMLTISNLFAPTASGVGSVGRSNDKSGPVTPSNSK